MPNYEVMVDGVDHEFEVDNLEEAYEYAENWVQDGDWGQPESIIYYSLKEFGEAGGTVHQERIKTIVGTEIDPPKCLDDWEHEWESPHEVVGGIRENPGVWGLTGTQVEILEVCRNCGTYRKTTTESTPGQYPKTPEQVFYLPPDEDSEAWARRE